MNEKNKHGAGNGTNISGCGIHILIIFFKALRQCMRTRDQEIKLMWP